MKIIIIERNKIIWDKNIEIPDDFKNAFLEVLEHEIRNFKNFSEITEEAKKEIVEGWK